MTLDSKEAILLYSLIIKINDNRKAIKEEYVVQHLRIGQWEIPVPIIQGGMGVGVSLSGLAGAVAREGGIGIISTAQIGFAEEGFEKEQPAANLRAIQRHVARAKEIAGGKGLVGVNVMTALKHYADHVRTAAAAGADVIICGAGLPADLPALIPDPEKTKIAPIVSSVRAAQLILKLWDHHYHRTADFLVVEGPLAGGHLGFSREQLAHPDSYDFEGELRKILACKQEYEEKYKTVIPVIAAGGIFDHGDVARVLSLGVDGVQIASRFVATKECDASEAYKQAYIQAEEKDIAIIQSPVGMPGRALRNSFIRRLEAGREPVRKCYHCLKKCNPAEVPYCITRALIDAVQGDVDHGLVFCGANTGRIREMTTVHDLIEELTGETSARVWS